MDLAHIIMARVAYRDPALATDDDRASARHFFASTTPRLRETFRREARWLKSYEEVADYCTTGEPLPPRLESWDQEPAPREALRNAARPPRRSPHLGVASPPGSVERPRRRPRHLHHPTPAPPADPRHRSRRTVPRAVARTPASPPEPRKARHSPRPAPHVHPRSGVTPCAAYTDAALSPEVVHHHLRVDRFHGPPHCVQLPAHAVGVHHPNIERDPHDAHSDRQ